jgi:hypothetical protein
MAMSNFNRKQEQQKTQQDLREVFIENYGVTMELPAYYYFDAKFVPHS